MSFPRYERYKDSGVEWLGEVPEHWHVVPIKSCFDVVGGTTPKSDVTAYWDGDIPWVTPADLSRLESIYISDTIRKITLDGLASCGTTLVPIGSIILSTRAPIGSIGLASVSVCTNQGCKALVPHSKIIPSFSIHLLSVNAEALNVRGKGATFLELSGDELKSFKIPLPTFKEQDIIVRFVDFEISKIDALIIEQQNLIALLKEKRQAVISNAVTKGLNPQVKMKDSGVEWLGEVPEHWGVAPLARISERIVVGIAEAATHAYADEGTPILRATNIRAGKIIGELLYLTADFADERDSKQIYAGDLVTVRTGNAGVTAVIPPSLNGCQCFTMLITTLNDKSVAEYYCYWMNSKSAQCFFSLEGWGTAQINISVPILKSLPVPIPSTIEQKEIVQFIDLEVSKIDILVAESEKAITLLQERRSALISAAVTGKIDVRNHAN